MDWIAPTVVFFGVIAIWLTVDKMQSRRKHIERKLNALLRHFNIDAFQGSPLSDRVKELARHPARKIEAIKVYHEEAGASLVEAKEAVEAFFESL